MIESITIRNIASFGKEAQQIEGAARVNFVFGANGTGKTTISRIIDSNRNDSDCKVTWGNGNEQKVLVYNRDFVEKNLFEPKELKGIFTLGEDQKGVQEEIRLNQNKISEIDRDIGELSKCLEKQKKQVGEIGDKFSEACWEVKKKYEIVLGEAFPGIKNSKERFRQQLIEQKGNESELVELSELTKKVNGVLLNTPEKAEFLDEINASELVRIQTESILRERVVGKSDSYIAKMIEELGNSDWVKEGKGFYDRNSHVCPFCQQETSQSFKDALSNHFDQTFQGSIDSINLLKGQYNNEGNQVLAKIDGLISSQSGFLDTDRLGSLKVMLERELRRNYETISKKEKEPSLAVTLEPIDSIIVDINCLIQTANTAIEENNKTVSNLKKERSTLEFQIWRFLFEEVKSDFEQYKENKSRAEQELNSFSAEKIEAESTKAELEVALGELKKLVTSIEPTIDEINKTLLSCGFSNFSLKKSDKEGFYELVRPDSGKDARGSLSEGEKTFVGFLYFYHLIEGSFSGSISNEYDVVVIDDPISSLDSEVLFLVGHLVRTLIDKVIKREEEAKSAFRQIFVFTHNVYFHKQITHRVKKIDARFWIVRKLPNGSKIVKMAENPVRSDYELLWDELKVKDKSSITIQNALRRILETYFVVWGGMKDLSGLCNHFEGVEKSMCHSLVSWSHAGSHSPGGDFYVVNTPEEVDIYLNIFEEIFKKTGQISHYKMMMEGKLRSARL